MTPEAVAAVEATDDGSASGCSHHSTASDANSSKNPHSSNDDDSSHLQHSQSGSSTTGASTGYSSGSHGNNKASNIPEDIVTRQETRAVNCSRLLVLSVLVLAAAVAGAMTYYWSKESQTQGFESQFNAYAIEIDDVSNHNAENVFRVTKSFSTSMTSTVLTMEATWPNVTIPHYEIKGDLYRQVTNVLLISYCPIVTDLDAWNEYSIENQGWIQDAYQQQGGDDFNTVPEPIPEQVYRHGSDGSTPVVEETSTNNNSNKDYCPLWQESQAPKDTSVVNYNLLSHDIFLKDFDLMRDTHQSVLSQVFDPTEILGDGARLQDDDDDELHPQSILIQPVYDDFVALVDDEKKAKVVGAIIAVIPWDVYFSNLLHEGSQGVVCVLRNTCGDVFSYQINGPSATYLGAGDYHDMKYDDLEHVLPFGPEVDFTNADDDADELHCFYTLHIFPTQELEDYYSTNQPIIFTVVVVTIFVFTTMIFMLYDYLVQRRQERVHTAAVKSNAIVSSLFPAEVRDRLFQNSDDIAKGGKYNNNHKGEKKAFETAAKFRLKNYLDNASDNLNGNDDDDDDEEHELNNGDGYNNMNRSGDGGAMIKSIPDMYETKPIADLFPNATVMFADIAGFTAWSSVREPSQVFTLLETVYRAFDIIAKRRRVFKVETVGDCYVAVTGLPEPRKDHAVAMCRFARDCMLRMIELSHQLEVILGPDTGDLAMRFGLHSGPVTAGVLRGDKSRFQLFGDTVNTAARIETTGTRHRIHLSGDTAELLKKHGKESWLLPRADVVVAKGKGEMKTYWLVPKSGDKHPDFSGAKAEVPKNNHTVNNNNNASNEKVVKDIIPSQTELSPKVKRLIDWNVDVLKRLLKLVVARRMAARHAADAIDLVQLPLTEKEIMNRDGTVLDEVAEIVQLPGFDPKTQRKLLNPNAVDLSEEAVAQLRTFVEMIATMYRDNPFHNFEHASHVTMSVSKLLSRIVAPDIDIEDQQNVAANLHDHTYGITSDPLTQFAVVISALIHDVDHVGIPNFLLVNENKELAEAYKSKSVAEQNSIDLAWKLLMEPRFSELRKCLYTDTAELGRFRQLMVNTVLATDIFDKELSSLRKARWEKAFNNSSSDTSSSSSKEDMVSREESRNRKATIVIEHLIQASDVAHTMQHWHIYQKWNERLFLEMYTAYKTGRSSNDPAAGWYKGEIGFFDNYVIPLAKKLQNCGVFGVSSDEYLNYALENRREWAAKGNDIVESMVAKYCEPSEDEEGSENNNNNGDGKVASESA